MESYMGRLFRFTSRLKRGFLHRGWYPTNSSLFHTPPSGLQFNTKPLSDCPPLNFVENKDQIIRHADEICTGLLKIWNTTIQIDGVPDWHSDPLTGYRWNSSEPSIPDRYFHDSSPPGALRRIWELNRHAWLFDLALAYRLTHNSDYTKIGIDHISDWIETNQPATGVNWTSPLESTIRLVAWVEFIRLVGVHAFPEEFLTHVARTLYAAARRTEWDLSLFPNPNNHLAGEALLLLLAGTLLRGVSTISSWRNTGLSLLSTYAKNQFGDSGSPGEQSTGYLLFVSEIYLYAAYLLRESRSDLHLSDDSIRRIAASLVFLDDLNNLLGYIPGVGDSDDAQLLGWDQNPVSRLDGLLTLGSRLFDIRLPKPRNTSNSVSVFNFHTTPEYEEYENVGRPTHYNGWIFISQNSTPWEVLLLASPLGLPPLHGHGHAHALSTIISFSGHPLIVDPGTYSYGEKAWRDFFRSTRAHATVVVEDSDQAQSVDTFTWRHPYSCSWKIVQNRDPIIIRAGHNGYKRLTQQVTHERIVQLSETTVVIKDSLSSCTDMEFSASLVWPLHPSITIHGENEGTFSMCIQEQNCDLYITGPGTPRIARGETSPVNGWYSPVFEKREPSSTIVVHATGRTISWRSEFRGIE